MTTAMLEATPQQTTTSTVYGHQQHPWIDQSGGTLLHVWKSTSNHMCPATNIRVIAGVLRVESSQLPSSLEIADWTETGVQVFINDPSTTDDAGVGYQFHAYPLSESEFTLVGKALVEYITAGTSPFVSHTTRQIAEFWKSYPRLVEIVGSCLAFLVESGLTEQIALRNAEQSQLLDPTPVMLPKPHVSTIHWLEEQAGLTQQAIADLVGVSRQTIHNWRNGDAIRDEKRQRLLAVQEVLTRVQERHHDADAIKTWLDTPRGPTAQTPRQLMMDNQIGKARALSLSTASPRSRKTPAWLRDAPLDSWTLREQRRKDYGLYDEASSADDVTVVDPE